MLLVVILLLGGILLTIALAFRKSSGAGVADVGNVIQGAFLAMRMNFRSFAAATLLLAGIPSFVIEYWNYDPRVESGLDDLSSWYWLIPSMTIGYLLQAFMVAASIRSLEGGGGTFTENASLVVRRILPIFGAIILSYAAMALASLFFLIPGLILLTMWIVIVPVMMVERCGVFPSFSRSSYLTRGSRWRIFALLLLFGFVILLFASLLELSLHLIGESRIGAAMAEAVSAAFSSVLLATLLASLYVELRRLKEGGRMRGLEDIFQ